ncbi:TrmH family RNA methyltransferase [Schlesneria paludicola]|uniref:TrmH family RNA methyltransferase n=1 Tax=Schlesneria paludicola TaxID=360056 RepID=UPI00029B137B|nr:RNA methyltransferase [Schlesneria paludicola]
MRTRELAICGLKAVRSRFESDSDSVVRLFFNRAMAPAVGDLCRWMAQERLVYRCVESEELERISGTLHHGGVVVIVEPPVYRSPDWQEIRDWADQRQSLLVLDRVSNVHNLGAIIRSAAYFGVSKLILPDHPQAALPTEATYRVAEGGLDHVEVYVVQNLVSFIRALRPHFHVMGAATRGGHPAVDSQQRLPCALVMGNEEEGLAPDVAAACTTLVSIPGSDRVESLNVSTAAAVLIWEMTRPKWMAPQRPMNPGPTRR